MHIERVPNRNSPPAVLLRQSYREGGKVRKRTLANLSKLPDETIEGLRILLKGGTAINQLEDAFEIIRSRPHGHVAAVLGTLLKLQLEQLIAASPSRERDLVIAMIVARVIEPSSKLATARGLSPETCTSTLGELVGVANASEDDLYEAMDWLLERQADIETSLAQRHLEEGTLVLYDVSSTYFEGETCPLAQYGYSRDRKKGKLQIVFGLLCNAQGCPIAVEVFEGNTADPTTLAVQIAAEAALDGLYVIRTSVSDELFDSQETVRAYKSLSRVERAFRSYKTVDLKVRPICHRLPERVRAHIFLCMLAYYVEWHMRSALAPMLFDDEDKALTEALRDSVVAPVISSVIAQSKRQKKRTEDDLPVHSFQTLLKDLATIVKNRVQPKLPGARVTFDKITCPTPLQQKAFDLLGISWQK